LTIGRRQRTVRRGLATIDRDVLQGRYGDNPFGLASH
jgi:hypothetical protein